MMNKIKVLMKKTKFIKWFSSIKLKYKVRYLFLFIIGVYFIMFFGIYSLVIKKDILNQALKSNLNTMISIGNNLNAEIVAVDNMSQLIMINKDVINYLKSNEQNLRYSQNAVSAVYDITNVFDHISSVFIIKLDGRYVNASRGITKFDKTVLLGSKWYQETVEKAGGYSLGINGRGAFTTTEEPVITFIRLVNDLETQKPVGILAINLSTDILESTYKDMIGENKFFAYYDEEYKYLYEDIPIKELEGIQFSKSVYDQMTAGDKKIVSYYRVPNTPFIITSYEKIEFGESISEEAGNILLVVLIVTSGALILIRMFITSYITNPIERLVQSMNSVKTGWFRRLSLSLPNDEIGNLKDSYNEMLVEINNLINKLIEKEKSIQKAELEVLQEQIKPHFLYNTLDTIGYLALKDSSDSVYNALETLGSFYRKFLSKGSKEIPISKEVEIVKDYLKLQKLRYGDSFEDVYELQENLLHSKIPKLILQPLVENSLYHGVRLKGEKGIIKISVYSKDEVVHIVVYDSGVGMSEKQIQEIMDLSESKSFGFKRTIERIQHYYQKEDIYEIRSIEGAYTEVDIKIPLNGGRTNV